MGFNSLQGLSVVPDTVHATALAPATQRSGLALAPPQCTQYLAEATQGEGHLLTFARLSATPLPSTFSGTSVPPLVTAV